MFCSQAVIFWSQTHSFNEMLSTWDVRMSDPKSAKDLFPTQLMSVLKGNLELGGDTEFPLTSAGREAVAV